MFNLVDMETQMGLNLQLFKFFKYVLCMKSVLRIRDRGTRDGKNPDPGWGKSGYRIPDKPPGSATLLQSKFVSNPRSCDYCGQELNN